MIPPDSGNSKVAPWTWLRDPNARLQGSGTLDSSKLQSPCIVRLNDGTYRLFYTAVGPARPFPACQGYILSARSSDGLLFHPEPGIRLAPVPELSHMALRLIAPSVTPIPASDEHRNSSTPRWRMYFEARGTADRPTVICSAVSADLLHWQFEDGIRLQSAGGVGAPRYLPLNDGRGRLYCVQSEFSTGTPGEGVRISQSIISAVTCDGLHFELEPGYRLKDRCSADDSMGISAAEVLSPEASGDCWRMFYSAWQDVPAGVQVPLHPSLNPAAVSSGQSDDFAAASIASDMAGYRSRIFQAVSFDGLNWERQQCIIQGDGYGAPGLDAVHAEDMSIVPIGNQRFRMYYAACDASGNWRIASAVNLP